ncbi:hypothetical protein K6U06_21830 [Acidiferrimicrobium sp. IK]|uniref:hypothetical protein n=1 Tax=Acidiferrimicrobium sp. IK TaxID=2871700 RepID=UPI0021CB7980|nr:hypothetical protein [Acidiferrimicrobium sp. IK]MCU4187021.1 hypothetical protein [Acidiferrimicrobium sp. IK]
MPQNDESEHAGPSSGSWIAGAADELRTKAAAGDSDAIQQLALQMLSDHFNQTIQALKANALTGNASAKCLLAAFLCQSAYEEALYWEADVIGWRNRAFWRATKSFDLTVAIPRAGGALLFESAARSGNGLALERYGDILLSRGDRSTARQMYLDAAESGRCDAMFSLAEMYGADGDAERATDWLDASVMSDSVLGLYAKANREYAHSWEATLRLLERAMELGDPHAEEVREELERKRGSLRK